MNAEPRWEQCLTFINRQLGAANGPGRSPLAARQWQAVTISRQAGSGGHAVAEELAELLQAQQKKEASPWTVFDRNLVEKVLEDHHLPARIARFMPEDRKSQIEDSVEELCGLHPPAWALVGKTTETILHLAELGNVILLGRGANIVTGKLDYVFHVRLVGSLAKRVECIQKNRSVGKKAALNFIRVEDRGRRRYLKKYFGKDIDDPLLYHLVINTDLVGHKPAARLIADAILSGSPGPG
jgi:cytidylate kinase